VIGLLLTLLIAFYLGGYAAGRMASGSGVKHGLLVALLALVVTDCAGAHRSGGGCKFHRPAWGRYTAWSRQQGCAERPAARVDYDPLGLWHPRPLVPVHRWSTRGCARGHSRTRAPYPPSRRDRDRRDG
jgi:hypothetical protein